MKIRTLFLSAAASTLAFAAVAQVENDDLYFNSKDRAKLQKQQTTSTPVAYAAAKTTKAKAAPAEELVNPTDSYSARNVNPEYTARANAQAAQADNQDYFVNNYQQTTSSNLNNYNNNLNSWYNNDIYSSNYYGSSINSWNSPYYGFNSPSMSPWYNPYYSNTGWSASFSYYWGSSWNYGWGGGYNYWNQPYCAMGWGGYSSMYGNPYYSNYNNYSDRAIAYGKRSSRSSSGANYSRNYDVTPTRTVSTSGRSSSSGNSSGRVASNQRYTPTSSSSTSPYYSRSWRKPEQTGTATSNRNTFFNSNTNSGWSGNNNNSGSRSSSSYSPSRSSSSSTFSGGSSSGSSGSRSSSSSSRSRGN